MAVATVLNLFPASTFVTQDVLGYIVAFVYNFINLSRSAAALLSFIKNSKWRLSAILNYYLVRLDNPGSLEIIMACSRLSSTAVSDVRLRKSSGHMVTFINS